MKNIKKKYLKIFNNKISNKKLKNYKYITRSGIDAGIVSRNEVLNEVNTYLKKHNFNKRQLAIYKEINKNLLKMKKKNKFQDERTVPIFKLTPQQLAKIQRKYGSKEVTKILSKELNIQEENVSRTRRRDLAEKLLSHNSLSNPKFKEIYEKLKSRNFAIKNYKFKELINYIGGSSREISDEDMALIYNKMFKDNESNK